MNAVATNPQYVFWIFMGLLVVGISTLLGMGVSAMTLFKLLKNDPQKREVSMVPGYVPEKDFNELRVDFKAFQAKRDADVSVLHEKVNAVAKDLSGMQAAFQLHNQYMSQMSNKMDRLLAQKRAENES